MYASLDDVDDRLTKTVDADDEHVTALLEEASALVDAYLGRHFEAGEVPETVRLVTARMVARVLEAPKESQFATQHTLVAGPFSQNASYSGGGSGGGPWLGVTDKAMLAPFRRKTRHVFSTTLR